MNKALKALDRIEAILTRGEADQPRVPAGNAEGGQWTKVSVWTQSHSEAQEIAKNLTGKYKQKHMVVFFPKAIPRRYVVADEKTFADEYAGQDWAKVTFTVTL